MQQANSPVPYGSTAGSQSGLVHAQPHFPWYAVRTRSNFELLAASSLTNRGFDPYVPTYRDRRRWSDRIVVSDIPFFKGYVFCRFNPLNRVPIVTAHGVVGIVSFGMEPAAIEEKEMEALQTVLRSGLAAEPYPFLSEGQPVRVLHGALSGVEGILIKKKSNFRLVISVTMLQRSVSVELDRDCISVI